MAVNLHATHFRFGIDELAENTHGWHAAEDVNPAQGVIAVDTTFLLRVTIQETGGTAAANIDTQFQCRLNTGAFQNITTTSSIVKAVAAAAMTNGGNCTKRLSGTGTFESSGAGQTEDGLSGGAANDIAASGNSETECGLQIVGTDVTANDVIEFRWTSPDTTITNDVVPAITIEGAVSYTLAVDPGSFTEAGTATNLLSARRLTASGSSYTGTGSAATLRSAFKIGADSASYGWTGSAASLSFGYRLSLDPASYTATGTAAGLHSTYKLASGSASFLETGTAAGLLKGSTLSAGPAAYTFAGTETALNISRAIVASGAEYTMNGTAASLLSALRPTLAPGSFTLTGQAAHAVLDTFPVGGGVMIIND